MSLRLLVISKEKFLSLDGAKDFEGNTFQKYNNDPVNIRSRLKKLRWKNNCKFRKINFIN